RRDRHRVQMGMSVHPQWRGQGIGRALLQAAVDYCVAHPLIRKFELGVIEQNSKALALYESFGFREEGRSKRGFFSDDKKYLDEILMGLWTES
ncbi:MAG: GNAT family N-acetyltransferase, partial [Pseudomonadota bacterium]